MNKYHLHLSGAPKTLERPEGSGRLLYFPEEGWHSWCESWSPTENVQDSTLRPSSISSGTPTPATPPHSRWQLEESPRPASPQACSHQGPPEEELRHYLWPSWPGAHRTPDGAAICPPAPPLCST